MRKIITMKSAAIILAAVFLISVIPIIALGFYAFPAADDFSYGAVTASALADSGSFAKAVGAAAEHTANVYQQWQGSFAAVFLMTMQPAIMGEGYYFLTTLIMLAALVIGTLLFLRELLMKCFGADAWQYLLISSIILIMTVHFCYYPAETFYWYNGGIYYAFFYSLSLVLGAAVMCALRISNKALKAVLTVCSALLCMVIGGGNYSTALCVMLILALTAAALALKKDKRAIIVLVIFAAGMAAFLFSVFAAGNTVRQQAAGESTNPVIAIILSVVLGGYIALNSLKLPVFLGFVCITPILYTLAKKSSFSFKRPLWFTIISFGVFCAQCTPPIYGLGLAVPERLLNIIYFSFYILALLNIFVWCGYVSRRSDGTFVRKLLGMVKNNSTAAFAALLVLFAALSVGSCEIGKSESGAVQISGLPLGAEAIYELVTGEAEAYRDTNIQRLEILQNSDIKQAVLPQYTAEPYLLYINDVTTDTADWRNIAVAEYYDKISVELK